MHSDEVRFPFFNRELSWLEFNARVLDEGLQAEVPLLERLRFLGIVSSNFDEFFMVRYASVKRLSQKTGGVICPSGVTAKDLMEKIHKRVRSLMEIQYKCLLEDLFPRLREQGICYLKAGMYNAEQAGFVRNLFLKEIFPILTPVKVNDDSRFPLSGNMKLHIMFELSSDSEEDASPELLTAVLQIPPGLERIIFLPDEEGSKSFTLLGDVIISNASLLFPGFTIQSATRFRVTRDADLGVDEERDEDFLEAMEEIVAGRERSTPVRLEVDGEGNDRIKRKLIDLLKIDPTEAYTIPGPLALQELMNLADLPGFDRLRNEDWKQVIVPEFSGETDFWESIRKKDLLLHHPYDSFDPVIRIVTEASRDPQVLAIKMTLYRTSGKSPLIRALAQAAENGKQVTVLVELKARFDEERNISWANQLEQSGVIVVYGIAKLKVHAKALLVVRREKSGIRRYVHLSTGNYNDRTARLYTDIGMFSAREDLAAEISMFFNAITGYSSIPTLRTIHMAPLNLKEKIISLIDRETSRAGSGEPAIIMAKMNALADERVIQALYRASIKGVQIFLNVRGICMLVPGVKGISENIHITSVIDRYLEHSEFCTVITAATKRYTFQARTGCRAISIGVSNCCFQWKTRI